ncbi:intraflagellar transport protein 27 homolog [Acanthaster planci]|uniref:Intraflagellar transport protein 27 homolog n=1 Tax=Acanthaster planci TaxID=133434 RepID=A0A8B7YLN7_ACAPL|nr:intraflagellar transport protein 27 homolog [Acanthaster planci]
MPAAMPVVLRAKCVVVGDSTVGKSALTQVFHSDGTHFPKAYSMTVGVELCVKTVNIPDTSNSVELYIYDSAGKEMFSDYIQQMWDSPSLAFVVFDLTNEKSLSSCVKWLERVKAKAGRDIHAVLVGNKTDLDTRRAVTSDIAKKAAAGMEVEYFECSAKERENVEAPFYFLANAYYKQYQEKISITQSICE